VGGSKEDIQYAYMHAVSLYHSICISAAAKLPDPLGSTAEQGIGSNNINGAGELQSQNSAHMYTIFCHMYTLYGCFVGLRVTLPLPIISRNW
jgi:hypothetical protein